MPSNLLAYSVLSFSPALVLTDVIMSAYKAHRDSQIIARDYVLSLS